MTKRPTPTGAWQERFLIQGAWPLDQAGHHGLWKPRFHALFAPRYGGRIFNLAALDHLTPCVADDDHSPAYTAETVLERAARHARERGGYTVRLNSLRAER